MCLIPILDLKLYFNCKVGSRKNTEELDQNNKDKVFQILDRATDKDMRRENELEPVVKHLG